MTEILSIDWMYFTGIRNGKITALFFDTERLPGLQRGDMFRVFYNKDNDIKMYFDSAKAIPFRLVDDKLANKAGFATKELLSSHLIDRYNLSTFHFGVEDKLKSELFYVITFVDDPAKILFDNGEDKAKLTRVSGIKSLSFNEDQLEFCKDVDKNYYINEMYNPEYDI